MCGRVKPRSTCWAMGPACMSDVDGHLRAHSVYISSVAAVQSAYGRDDAHVFTEDDWNGWSTLQSDAYGYAKTQVWVVHSPDGASSFFISIVRALTTSSAVMGHLTTSPSPHLPTSPPPHLPTSPPHHLPTSPPHQLTISPSHHLPTSPPHHLPHLPHLTTSPTPGGADAVGSAEG